MPQKKHDETKKPSLFARIKQAILGSPKEMPEPVKMQATKAVPQKKDNARSQNSEYGSVPAQVSEYGFMPSIGNAYGDVPDKSRAAKVNEYGDVPDKSSAAKTASASPPPSNYAAKPTASPPPSNYAANPTASPPPSHYVTTPSPTPPSNSPAAPNAQPKTPHLPIKINELDAQFLESHTLPQVNYHSKKPSEIILSNYGMVLGNMERAIANQDLAKVAQKMGAQTPDPSAKLQAVDIHFEDSKDGKSAILSVSLRLGQDGKIGKDEVSNISKNFDLNNKDELNAFVQYLNQNAAKPAPIANTQPVQAGTNSTPSTPSQQSPTSATTVNSVKADKPQDVKASLAASLAKILELKAAANQGKENTANNATSVPSTRFDDGAKPSAPSVDEPTTPPRFLGTEATREHGVNVTAAFDQQKKANGDGASNAGSKEASAGELAADAHKATRPR